MFWLVKELKNIIYFTRPLPELPVFTAERHRMDSFCFCSQAMVRGLSLLNSLGFCYTKCPPLAENPGCSPSPSDTLGQTLHIGAACIRQSFSPSVGFREDTTWLTLGLQTLGSWGEVMVDSAGHCLFLPFSFSEQPVCQGPSRVHNVCPWVFAPTVCEHSSLQRHHCCSTFLKRTEENKNYMYLYSSLI